MKEKGLRLTRQRVEIVDILSSDISHPGARHILQKARERVPNISLSTVYYTLDVLKKAGFVKEIEFYDQDNRFDGNIEDHIHLICTSCGAIIDFHEDVPASDSLIKERTGFDIQDKRFEYFGRCSKCKES